MAKNEALAVLHAALDFRRAIDVPGYDGRWPSTPPPAFIGTMNYGYAGTRELNEALTSRFVVIDMPPIDEDGAHPPPLRGVPDPREDAPASSSPPSSWTCRKSARAPRSPPRLWTSGACWTRCASSGKAWPPAMALDMGISNKAFDAYEQGLIRDVITARIPAKLDRAKLFTD